MHIPIDLLVAYGEMLPELQAEDQLSAAEVEQLPWMKDADRRSTFRRWKRSIHTRAKKASSDDLTAMGIAVEEVSHG